MSLLSTPLIHLLSCALKLTVQRQTLNSQNTANVDTPGYHTRDIDFRQEFERAMSGEADDFPAMAREVPGLIARPDGNNVNVDREGLVMAENQLRFQTAVTVMRSEFERLQSAISGGSGQ
jgi:flagellar basal-body rod protein FlgB